MDESLHYLTMANQMLMQKTLMEQLKDTGLTIGQPKILDYLRTHDGSSQKEIAQACFLEAGSLTTILNKIEERALNGISEEDLGMFMAVYKKLYSNLQDKRNE